VAIEAKFAIAQKLAYLSDGCCLLRMEDGDCNGSGAFKVLRGASGERGYSQANTVTMSVIKTIKNVGVTDQWGSAALATSSSLATSLRWSAFPLFKTCLSCFLLNCPTRSTKARYSLSLICAVIRFLRRVSMFIKKCVKRRQARLGLDGKRFWEKPCSSPE